MAAQADQAHVIFDKGELLGLAAVSLRAISEALRSLRIGTAEAFENWWPGGLGQHRNTDDSLK